MKKLLVVLAVIVFAGFTSPAFALFTNGGFETGDFTGWLFDYGERDSWWDTKNITWGKPNNGLSAVMSSGSPNQSGQTLDINPYNGTYMARINDIYGNYHATKIYQADTITAADIASGSTLYVNWGAALIEPSNAHPEGAQPYFGINVLVNNVPVGSFSADALDTAGWTNAGNNGGTLWYHTETWSYNLSSFNIGDTVKIEMFVSDCGWGGHGGFAFLDGIGTVYQPPTGVPEPSTLLLLGSGLIGLGYFVRKRMKK